MSSPTVTSLRGRVPHHGRRLVFSAVALGNVMDKVLDMECRVPLDGA